MAVNPATMSSFKSYESEKLFNMITKDGKSSNLERLLLNQGKENSIKLLNEPIQPKIYPIHIVALRAKDHDLDRKLGIMIKHGADINASLFTFECKSSMSLQSNSVSITNTA